MSRHLCNTDTEHGPSDIVYTPPEIARQIIERYRPSGRVLDPCRGDGAFWALVPEAEWCEIDEGRDFFNWTEPVDWLIGNPPYSIMNRWMAHSMKIAENIVYLLPIAKLFGSRARLVSVCDFGLKEVWAPWTGRRIGFPFGWACGCVWLQRGYSGPVRFDHRATSTSSDAQTP